MKKRKNLRFKFPYTEDRLEASKFITRALDGSDYERGSLETVEAQARNVTEAFGRLIQVLSDKDIITDGQVHFVALGYYGDEDHDL